MIFVTYGSENFNFARLTNEILSIISSDCFKHQKFVVQMGSSYKEINSPFNNFTIFKYCPYKDFINYINEAEIIITHGGVGNIITILKMNKIPIVIPRLKRFDEQVDDHQIQIAEMLANKNHIIYLSEVSKLKDCITNYPNEVQKLELYKKAPNYISNVINNFLL